MKWTEIDAGKDAVILPGKIHGTKWQVYIIYLNENANDGNGSFEIEVVDAYRILKLYADVRGDANAFFEELPDLFQGEWYYCDNDGSSAFDEYVEAYANADFVVGKNGDQRAEMLFLVDWAVKAIREESKDG